jgi:uncharacterized protein (DUF1330 family)
MNTVNLIIVAKINPAEKEALSQYLEGVAQLYQQVEAQSISKYKISEASIGEYTPSIVSIMQFRDKESLDNVFESKAYQALIPLRDKAFLKVESYIS